MKDPLGELISKPTPYSSRATPVDASLVHSESLEKALAREPQNPLTRGFTPAEWEALIALRARTLCLHS